MDTEVVEKLTPIIEYSPTAAALADLEHRYKGVVFDVTTRDGMATAIKGRAELRGYRVALEKKRVEIKAPALERTRLIDAEAKRLSAALSALENPIDQVIVQEQTRREREKAEREAAEAARIARINECLAEISNKAGTYVGKPSTTIAVALEDMRQHNVATWAEEFLPAAAEAKGRAIATLEQLHAGALAQEQAAAAEVKRIEEERAELARLRAEQAERNRMEQARIAKETREREEAAAAARAKIAEEEAASRRRIEEAEREARAVREEADRKAEAERQAALQAEAKARAEKDAQERKERAARDAEAAKVAAEQEERERALKAEADRQEAARQELERQQRETLATERMIEVLRERIGTKRQYAGIAKAIDSYLATKAAP